MDMTKTNNFFNTTPIPKPPISTHQLLEQQFQIALPIPQNNNSNSSSSFESQESSSTNSSPNENTPNSPSNQQQVHKNSLLGSSIQSPSTGTHYLLNRFLGQGTFSQVIQASSTQHPSVALKLIRTFGNSTPLETPTNLIYQDQIPADEYQFISLSALREIEILKSIDHPSIIKLIETFTIPDYEQQPVPVLEKNHVELMKKNSSLKVIVLEEIRGGELFELVSKSKHFLKPTIICRLMAELCIAVHWLHSNHIVHRDLKLENILLVREIKNEESTVEEMKRNRNVCVKLTDFGLSVKMGTEEQNGLLSSRCGSEEYAAPEIILGRKYDGRKTDAWALGVIGYSLATGTLPFKLPEPYLPPPSPNNKKQDDLQDDLDYQVYLKKRKSGLLKIIKSDFTWSPIRSDVDPHIAFVNSLLFRDPLKRPTDLLFGFRDPLWLGQFDWLKNLFLSP